jgi:hypothetical protein
MQSVIRLTPYTPQLRDAWHHLVDRSRNGTFLHQRDYMEYHADRFTDASLLFFREDRAVAALPATLKDGFLSSHAGLSYGGLVMDPELHAWEALSIFEAVAAWGHSNGMCGLAYKSIPHIYHRTPAEEDLYALYRLGARLVRRDLSTCIRLDGNAISASKGRRSCVAKARRLGLTVIESRDYAGFMEIAERELQAKYGLRPTHNASELAMLAGRFPERVRLLGGYLGERLLGGVVLYLTDTVCHVQYIAATEEGRQCGVVDLCVHEAITNFSGDRRWFDFGVSTTDEGRNFNQNLTLNKESWGARTVVFDHYILEFEGRS